GRRRLPVGQGGAASVDDRLRRDGGRGAPRCAPRGLDRGRGAGGRLRGARNALGGGAARLGPEPSPGRGRRDGAGGDLPPPRPRGRAAGVIHLASSPRGGETMADEPPSEIRPALGPTDPIEPTPAVPLAPTPPDQAVEATPPMPLGPPTPPEVPL